MLSNKFRSCISIVIFAPMFVLSGCMIEGKVAGGGWLEGAEGGKANFGFNAAQCDWGLITGNFNYHDKKAGGLRIKGEIVDAGQCVDPGEGGIITCDKCTQSLMIDDVLGCTPYQVKFDYISKDKKNAGEGTGFACVLDCGEGNKALVDDVLYIELDDGPFDGYTNGGFLGGGNIQAGQCTCTDGLDNDGDGLADLDDVDCNGDYGVNGSENIPQIF